MGEKSQYKTRQREELIDCLKTMPGRHFTAAELCQRLSQRGRSVGASTVYRHLERLVSEGLVSKYFIDENSGACFSYVDPREHCREAACYHCRCERCGRLIHLSCAELDALQEHLRVHHRFAIDPMRTVFYGVCERCRDTEGDIADERET